MKIFELIPSFESGGAERLVIDISNEFGFSNEVTICSLKPIENHHFYFKDINPHVRTMSLYKAKGFKIRYAWKLYKIIKKEKPGIVHSHLASTFHYLVLSIILLRKIQFIHTLHNHAEKEERIRFIWLIRRLLIKTRRLHFVSLSNAINESYKELYNSDFKVIYNGRPQVKKTELFEKTKSEIDKLKKDPNTRVFINIGRLTYQKNQKLLVEAFKQAQIDNSILLIIGKDYSDDQTVTKRLKQISDIRTYFLGEKSNISDYMILSDVFCLSSIYEGMPITIIEAFSAGLPVISTAVGGVVDMIENNVNGILVKDFSVESYKKSLIRFSHLNEEEIREIREANIKKYQKEYTIKTTADNYINFFREIINKQEYGLR